MKQGSTIFLKLVVLLIGGVILAICIFLLPRAIISELAGDFDYLPILLGMYVPAVPFFYALYQALKLLNYIEEDSIFSEVPVKAMKNIKLSAIAISGLYALGMPYIFYVGERDDAPGLVLLGLVIIFASSVIATAAAVFQRLLQNAVDIKSENDFTV